MPKLDKLFPKTKRPSQKDRGLGVVVHGDWETGKTFLACTAPEPVLILDMDDGTEALWEQYDHVEGEAFEGNFADRDIRIIEIPIASEMDDAGLDDTADINIIEFETNLVNALDTYEKEFAKVEALAIAGELNGGTVCLDTATWMWMGSMDFMKYKVLKMDPTARNFVEQMWDWDVANKKYINLYKRLMGLRRHGVNVIINVHVKDKWETKQVKGKAKGVKTDQTEPHWQKKSPQMSPFILEIEKVVSYDEELGMAVEKRITKCVRMRGVPNATKLWNPVEDITWEKLLNELHEVRKRHEEGGVEAHQQTRKVARRGRRQRGRQAKDESTEEPAPEVS